MKELKPLVAIFTESWLDASTPDSALSIDGYAVSRKDRCRNGGGIIAYIDQAYKFRVITASEIPSLSSCESEILTIQFTNTPLLIISVYHPFWNDCNRNDNCIAIITELIDYGMMTSSFDITTMKLVVCGDFNGLQHNFSEIAHVTQLSAVVATPTRGSSVLDQIFVNFCHDHVPKVLPPIGKSDHKVVFWNASRHAVKPFVKKVLTRKVSAGRKHLFFQLVANIDWLNLIQSANDLDACVALFYDRSLLFL